MAHCGKVRSVELVQAFLWVCDDCGRDNFERAMRVEPGSMEGREIAEYVSTIIAEADEAAEALGAQINGDWLTAPLHVKCAHCGGEFDTDADG